MIDMRSSARAQRLCIERSGLITYGRFVDQAWIAVIGTVSGVAVTATSSLLTSMLTARHQRTIAERQLAEADSERTRAEVRESFIEYLGAYSALRDQILVLHHQQRTGEPDTPAGANRISLIEAFAPEESTRFNRAHHTIQITAGEATCAAANTTSSQLWDLAQAAEERDQDLYSRELAAGVALRRRLHAAMRAELQRGR
jgi:hypothetical protein